MPESFRPTFRRASASASLRQFIIHAISSVMDNFNLGYIRTYVLGVDALLNQKYLDRAMILAYGSKCKRIAIRIIAEPRAGYETETRSLIRMNVRELVVYPIDDDDVVRYDSPLVTVSVNHNNPKHVVDIPGTFFDAIYAYEVDNCAAAPQ